MGQSAVEGDLLGGGDAPQVAAATAPVAPPTAVGASLDPLDDLLGGGAAAATASAAAAAAPPADDPFAA